MSPNTVDILLANLAQLNFSRVCASQEQLNSAASTFVREARLVLESSGFVRKRLADGNAVAAAIKQYLTRKQDVNAAVRFQELHGYLQQTGISHEASWGLLTFLLKVSKDVEQAHAATASAIPQSHVQLSSAAALGSLEDVPRVNLPQRSHTLSSLTEPGTIGPPEDVPPGTLADVAKAPLAHAVLTVMDQEAANEVPEPYLVQDVIHACQGIDGRFIQFNPQMPVGGCYVVVPEALELVSPVKQALISELCELGWLYRKVSQTAKEGVVRAPVVSQGRIWQAFCSTLQEELSEYYRLMAVLQSQSVVPLPQPGMSETAFHGSSSSYLTLRRLVVWLSDAKQRMRMLAVLADAAHGRVGGVLVEAIHMHGEHGDGYTYKLAARVLQRVCMPLFEMVRKWIFEGELDDPHSEFFISSVVEVVEDVMMRQHQEIMDDIWREKYHLSSSRLPSFINRSTADHILRAGKSINFLRTCCDDTDWVQQRIADSANVPLLQISELDNVVRDAVSSVDARLMHILFDKYHFVKHLGALKDYLLLSQGDFAAALLEQMQSELDKPAGEVSELALTSMLKLAIGASNAKYDDDDVLDRLRVEKQKALGGVETGWDVFRMVYDVNQPLATVFNAVAMSKYDQISALLWKMKRVELKLAQCWQLMKLAESILSGPLRRVVKSDHITWYLLRKCLHIRAEMAQFNTNLQNYILFEAVEGQWLAFQADLPNIRNMDELINRHMQFLQEVFNSCLLDVKFESVKTALERIFKECIRLHRPVHEFCTEVRATAGLLYSRGQPSAKQAGGWGRMADHDFDKKMEVLAANLLPGLENSQRTFDNLLEHFTDSIPKQAQHVDLRFLMFRLAFADFRRNASDGSSTMVSVDV